MSVRLSGPPPGVRGSQVDTALLKTRARDTLRVIGHARAELSLSLIDDDEMRELNRHYRSKDRSTDVLSFSLFEGEGAEFRGGLLGDVVIGIETAARQAAARHRALDEEVMRLLVHGVLHLIGHDHERDEEAARMLAEERRVLRCLREAT